MEKIKYYAMLLLMATMGVIPFVSCGGEDDEEPVDPEPTPTLQCYTEPSNILLMSDGLAFNWNYGSDTKYFYWETFTQDEYNKLSESEIIKRVVTNDTDDRITPDYDDLACVYNCKESTSYVIVTISYSEGDKQGDIVKTPMTTKSTKNQPIATINDVSYYKDTSSGNTYYGWTAQKNNYCKQYYTYAAASPDIFYSYYMMDNGFTPMIAWEMRNEITKNGEDHSTGINETMDWDFDNGRDMFFGAQVESGKSYLRAFNNIDKYFMVLTWASGASDELSGVFEKDLYTLSTSSSAPQKVEVQPMAGKSEGPKKIQAHRKDFKLVRLD